jgi:hypothetical protein
MRRDVFRFVLRLVLANEALMPTYPNLKPPAPGKRRTKRRESWRQPAARFGVHPRTLDRWVRAGVLDPPEYIRGRKYGDADAVPRTDAA